MFLLASFSGSELEAAAGRQDFGGKSAARKKKKSRDAEERSEYYTAQPTTGCSSLNIMVD